MRYASSHCTCTEVYTPEHAYIFTGPCMLTGKSYSVTVPAPQLFAYNQGGMIQDAMPTLSREDREFLMSGYSPEGWDLMFGEQEESEPENDPVCQYARQAFAADLDENGEFIVKLHAFTIDGIDYKATLRGGPGGEVVSNIEGSDGTYRTTNTIAIL